MGLALPDRITHLNGNCFKLNITEFSEISCFLLLKMKTPWSKWQSEVKSQDFEALQRTRSLTHTPTWAMPLSSLFWCTNILEPCWCCKDCPFLRGQLLGTVNEWPASALTLCKLMDQTHTPSTRVGYQKGGDSLQVPQTSLPQAWTACSPSLLHLADPGFPVCPCMTSSFTTVVSMPDFPKTWVPWPRYPHLKYYK